ncbi:flagellar hook-length control protein FliK [Paenibacillus caui]|uniref:flagellar hook-length control protein FliK n=1 Tax=Paenibacillus caui TaxID=2873927 RepID=UPI001CA7EDDD|nr:flagellar hook-length control protein FliK [Paenibacillus caui]
MNIGPILRGALGKSQPADARTLELRTGQVVRGTVLSVSEDGAQAVVEVQGVKLKAALESPLRQGQSMMMQVQPPGGDGQTVLKPLLPGAMPSGGDPGVEQLLKNAGLDNTPDNRELVKLMQSAGMPVTREQAEALIRTLAARPAEVPLAEWVNAAAIAVQRGLELSGEIVGGLRQAIYGPPVHQLIAVLEDQLAALLRADGGTLGLTSGQMGPASSESLPEGTAAGSSAGTGSAVPGPGAAKAGEPASAAGGAAAGSAAQGTVALLQKLQSVLGELRAELAAGQQSSRASAPGAQANAAAAGFPAAGGSAAAPGQAAQEAAPPPQGGAAPELTRPAHETESWVGRVLKLLGAEHEQQAGRALLLASARHAAAPQETPPGQGAAARAGGGEAAPPGAGAAQSGAAPAASGTAAASAAARAAAGGSAGAAAGAGAEAPTGSSGTAAGSASAQPAGGEAPAAKLAAGEQQAGGLKPLPSILPAESAAELPASSPAAFAGSSADDAAAEPLKESLKSVLLQIMDAPDAPPQLQEAARQMVQQLTGQQLLLNTDRTAPFAQITMFLPFKGPDGGETATIQIQSRRGRRGELDPDNCRLWFDLNMSALGKLMVDVQVADKKVILQIHSEGEEVSAFLENRREEVSEAIKGAGYRLVELRTESYPVPAEDREENVSQSGAISYVPSVYRGVDYRV